MNLIKAGINSADIKNTASQNIVKRINSYLSHATPATLYNCDPYLFWVSVFQCSTLVGVQRGKYLGVANWAKGGWEVSAQSGESELRIRGK